MSKLLITGAAGFIGSHLAERCLMEDHEVVGVDAFKPYYDAALKRDNLVGCQDQSNFRLIDGDLVEMELASLLDGVEVLFHLAGQPGVRASWGDSFQQYVESNVTATQRVLEAAYRARVPRVVFASSSSVYGDADVFPTSETAELQPVSPYGATKVLGEHLCRLYHRSFGLPVVRLRYFTVYGPRQRPDMAFNKLIRAALDGEQIVIYGDGEQTRDFTYVADAVQGTIDAAGTGAPGEVYNLGGGTRSSMNEVLPLIAQATARKLNVIRVADQLGDARHTAADTTRAREDLGFAPARALRDGIRAQVRWQQART